jgi:hypothetical protein
MIYDQQVRQIGGNGHVAQPQGNLVPFAARPAQLTNARPYHRAFSDDHKR